LPAPAAPAERSARISPPAGLRWNSAPCRASAAAAPHSAVRWTHDRQSVALVAMPGAGLSPVLVPCALVEDVECVTTPHGTLHIALLMHFLRSIVGLPAGTGNLLMTEGDGDILRHAVFLIFDRVPFDEVTSRAAAAMLRIRPFQRRHVERGGGEAVLQQIAHHLIAKQLHAAIGVVDHEPLASP
jgi:hypothetical protein